MGFDVIVVGGSYGGMAAALQLLRGRRTVLVIDGGKRRNRFTSHAHGFLGQDGVAPGQIAAVARAQLEDYPDLTWVDGEAVALSGTRDAFEVETAAGESYQGRRVLFATGLRDTLPEVEGLAERWGQSVFHCPYCHGYELNRGPIGVLGNGEMSLHQAQLLPEWGAVTFLPNGTLALDAEMRDLLSGRGVIIDETKVTRIAGTAEVHLADGRVLDFAGLFVAPELSPASTLPERAGCALKEMPFMTLIATDETKQTSIPGVYACGDVAHMPQTVTLAVADGAMAGFQLHRSLVWPDA